MKKSVLTPNQAASIEKKFLEFVHSFFCEYCNLFITNNKFASIKSFVGHLQFMVRQKNNLTGNLIFPRILFVE